MSEGYLIIDRLILNNLNEIKISREDNNKYGKNIKVEEVFLHYQ